MISLGQVTVIGSAVPEGAKLLRDLKKCSRCGSIAIAPIPEDELIEEYYDRYSVEINKKKQSWSIRTVLEPIQGIAKEIGKGRVLDIGCGDGSLLAQLPTTFEKFGVDLSKTACEIAGERGIHVVRVPFLKASFSETFDMVIALDVLEHFHNPREALRYMARILAPGGCLVIQTGNADCFVARFLGEDWAYTAVFGHLCALTPSGLRIMTSELGLDEISLRTSWHVKPRWPIVIYRNVRAYGFHTYRRLYALLKPLLKNISFLRNLYYHHPPQALNRDHFTYIGRKVSIRRMEI